MNKTQNKSISCFWVAIAILSFGLIIFGIVSYRVEQNNDKLATELNNSNNILTSIQTELITVQNDLKLETEKVKILKESLEVTQAELAIANTELEMANITISDLTSEEYEFVYIGNFKLTHYCNEAYEHICGYGDGLTAIGTKVKPGITIAVDPKVIPYGTEVYIEGYGWRVAEDCGGGVKGNHIDVAVDTHSEAMANGVKYSGVWVLVKKNS